MNQSQTFRSNRWLATPAQWWRRWVRDVWDNPVTRKELRGRMRTGRTFVTLSLHVVFLSLFLLGLYALLSESWSYSATTPNLEEIGSVLFGTVVGMEMLLIGFTVPNLTAGAISGERERQTYDLLRVTLLPARTLIVGKLMAALAYAGLLLLVAVPLQSVAFFFGGINAADVWMSLWVMSLEALFMAAIGLYFSAHTRRTFSAKGLTYVAIVFLAFALPFVGSVLSVDWDVASYQMDNALTVYVAGVLLCFNPALALLLSHAVYTQHQALFTFQYTMSNGQTLTLLSPWLVFSVLYLGLTALLLVLATRRMRRVEG